MPNIRMWDLPPGMADAVTEGVRREARRWFELPVSSPTCSHVIPSLFFRDAWAHAISACPPIKLLHHVHLTTSQGVALHVAHLQY